MATSMSYHWTRARFTRSSEADSFRRETAGNDCAFHAADKRLLCVVACQCQAPDGRSLARPARFTARLEEVEFRGVRNDGKVLHTALDVDALALEIGNHRRKHRFFFH